MATKETKKPTLVTLTAAHREWLKNESDKTGEPMTSIIRRAIESHIKANKNSL